MPAGWVAAGVGVLSYLDSQDSKDSANAANQASSRAADASAVAQGRMAQISEDQWNYYKTNYQPLETKLIGQAQAAGSPEEFARNRGAANADVTGAFDQAKKQTKSRLESYGINPGSPAYQSSLASADIAEGATKAGALTMADNNTRNLAYSKALDVVGLGRNIPAQSAASGAAGANAANNAMNAATNSSALRFNQNQTNMKNLGYGLGTVGNAAKDWFGSSTNPNANYDSSGMIANPTTSGNTYSLDDRAFGAKGGKVKPHSIGYADGGAVIDAEKTGDGEYDATALKGVLQKKGLNPNVAHSQAHGAAARHKGAITPHMRRFAGGGGVGRQGLEGPDASSMGELAGPGTETSDSVPAEIDGEQPAALSTGEFVMNAEVPKLTGDEILQAINDAGLKKRGLEPRTSNDVSINAGTQAYADGGEVDSEEGAMKRIEADQRRDAAEVATEKHRRAHISTGNAYFSGGMHTPSGKIYDSTSVGRPDPRDTYTPRHERFSRAGL